MGWICKHSVNGLVTSSVLENRVVSKSTAKELATLANFGLSGKTWNTYQTTINHLNKCENDTGANMSLPFDLNKTLEFIGWMKARGLKSRTMSTYLSGVRMHHISLGYN